MVTRRTFILAGLAGSAALVGAYWLRQGDAVLAIHAGEGIARDARPILRTLAASLLAGALPQDRERALDSVLEATARQVEGLPPAAQREFAELMALLAWPPGRIAFAGLWPSWSSADRASIDAVLERWRGSSLVLRRSAYAALHQIVFAAWYGLPEAWPAIGYPGPPRLG